MRILQVNKLYYPCVGGVETVARLFAEQYDSRPGMSVTNLVCKPRGKRETDVVDGVITHRARTWRMQFGMPLSLDFFYLFWKLIRETDLIVLHHPFPLAFVAYCLFGNSKRLVIWYHSDIVRQKLTKLPFEPFLRYGLRQADAILVSNHTIIHKSGLLRRYAGKCRVVRFGVDSGRFERALPDCDTVKEIRGDSGLPLVLSVGRLVYYKGFSYLIDAMREVSANLLIVGSGPLERTLGSQILKCGLAAKVRIRPSVPDLAPYYHACDVFVLASCEPSEVFGIVQIEAMACGKPVINTSLPTGVPEVSVDGRSGYTVPIRNAQALSAALNKILSDKHEYARLSRNAVADVANRFTLSTMFTSLDMAIGDTIAAIRRDEEERHARTLTPVGA